MPRYEYKCRKCEKNFDVTHGINDTVERCVHCDSTDIRRVFHPVGIVFKGSGFYATDSKKPPNLSCTTGCASQDDGTSTSCDASSSDTKQKTDNGSGDTGSERSKEASGTGA